MGKWIWKTTVFSEKLLYFLKIFCTSGNILVTSNHPPPPLYLTSHTPWDEVLATATALSIHLLKTGEGLLHACISSYRTTLFTTFSVSRINIGVRGKKIVGRTIVWPILKEIFQENCPRDGGRQNFQDLIWRLRITKFKKRLHTAFKYSLAVNENQNKLCYVAYCKLSFHHLPDF
jgi:hypothetical protein